MKNTLARILSISALTLFFNAEIASACPSGNLKILQDRFGRDIISIDFQNDKVKVLQTGVRIIEIGFQDRYLETRPNELCVTPGCPNDKDQEFDLAAKKIALMGSPGGLEVMAFDMGDIGGGALTYFVGNFELKRGCGEVVRP